MKRDRTERDESQAWSAELPPMRAPYATLRYDLADYARDHTGPESWSADERDTEVLDVYGI